MPAIATAQLSLPSCDVSSSCHACEALPSTTYKHLSLLDFMCVLSIWNTLLRPENLRAQSEIVAVLLDFASPKTLEMCIKTVYKCPTCRVVFEPFSRTYACNHEPCVGMVGLQFHIKPSGFGAQDPWYCPQSSCPLSFEIVERQASILQDFVDAQVQGRMGERSFADRLPAMLTWYGSEGIHNDEEELRHVSAGVEALGIDDQVAAHGTVGVDNQMLATNLPFGQFEPAPATWDDVGLSELLDSVSSKESLRHQKDSQFEQPSALEPDKSTLGVADPASKEDQRPADWTITAALEAQANARPGPTHRQRGGRRLQLEAATAGQSTAPSNNSNRGGLYPAQWDITSELQSQIAALTAEVAEQTRVLKPSDNRWVESERKLLALLRKNRPIITHHDIHEWFIPRHTGTACESDWSRQKREEAARRV